MDTTFDQLVTTDAQSGLIVTRGIPISSLVSENIINTSTEEFILDLSQRPITEITNRNYSMISIDDWKNDSPCSYTDNVDEDLNRPLLINDEKKFNIEQSLIDQIKHDFIQDDSLSDSSNKNQSKLDINQPIKRTK